MFVISIDSLVVFLGGGGMSIAYTDLFVEY